MRFGRVREVMVFVDDPAAAVRFWSDALQLDPRAGLPLLDLGHIELFFNLADPEKNPQGGSTVVYFEVDDFDATRDALLAAGCKQHHGPLAIEDGRRICQLRDPFGTVWGLNGPSG